MKTLLSSITCLLFCTAFSAHASEAWPEWLAEPYIDTEGEETWMLELNSTDFDAFRMEISEVDIENAGIEFSPVWSKEPSDKLLELEGIDVEELTDEEIALFNEFIASIEEHLAAQEEFEWPSWIGTVEIDPLMFAPVITPYGEEYEPEVYEEVTPSWWLLDQASRSVEDRSTTPSNSGISGTSSNGRTIFWCLDNSGWCYR